MKKILLIKIEILNRRIKTDCHMSAELVSTTPPQKQKNQFIKIKIKLHLNNRINEYLTNMMKQIKDNSIVKIIKNKILINKNNLIKILSVTILK